MLTINRFEVADWHRLRAVRLLALDDEPDAFGSSLERETGFVETDWRHMVELGPWWVAVADDRDVGVVAGGRHREHDVPWVFSMWVAQPWRGRGVATSLLDTVVRWAVESGATQLGLDVADRAPRARRFYERYGFVDSQCSFPMPRDVAITLVEMHFDLSGPRAAH